MVTGLGGPAGPYPNRFLSLFALKVCDRPDSNATAQLPPGYEGERKRVTVSGALTVNYVGSSATMAATPHKRG
ncbi:hypothetical protein ALI144C_15400 [Actinosynnema sp. ALI-1.44]|uniref:hypothetical protein n=1 Tax=Actinosynnema sp. ALI-1.44 TaxID=1933779 RepID=UPI00097BA9AE|nr:hypothetical protein [Actinosynnema sp. ALI-1.44]ONI84089.1 hypothetical protein ALI144C_15400 [Actinosynnema sp. ALI-1.44]